MGIAKGNIDCGICGFKVQVAATSDNGQDVKLEITSTCPSYEKIAAELKEVDAYNEIFSKLHKGNIYQVFSEHASHQNCPGLSGILKTIEVAAGLALPKNATIEITKDS